MQVHTLKDIVDHEKFFTQYHNQILVIEVRPYTVERTRDGRLVFFSANGLHHIEETPEGWICYSSTPKGDIEQDADNWVVKQAGTLEEAATTGGLVGYLGPMCYDPSRQKAIKDVTERSTGYKYSSGEDFPYDDDNRRYTREQGTNRRADKRAWSGPMVHRKTFAKGFNKK